LFKTAVNPLLEAAMDPISLLLSALAAPVLRPVADQAVKDGYMALKALLLRKFGAQNPKLEPTLADHAEDPETYRAPMAKVLQSVEADRDQEVLNCATDLLKRIAGPQSASITVIASGERSVAIGGAMSGGTIVTGDQPKVPPSS
jgi:hypothetical protein